MHEHTPEPALLCHIEYCKDMLNMAVDSAVGQKSHDVQRLIIRLGVVHCFGIGWIFEEVAVGYRLGDARQILKHNAARADIRVPYLTVSHLPLRQADVHTRCGKLGIGVLGKYPVKVRGIGPAYGVAGGRGGNAEAIHDNKNGLTHRLHPLRQ